MLRVRARLALVLAVGVAAALLGGPVAAVRASTPATMAVPAHAAPPISSGRVSADSGAAPLPAAAVLIRFDSSGAQQTRIARGTRNAHRAAAAANAPSATLPFAPGAPVTADDPVRVASLSKLVVALGVMRLVERRQVDLDADVSRYLGWVLRNPRQPNRPITLAMLLGHRAGLVDGVDYALPLDADLEQVLRQPAAWAAGAGPNRRGARADFRYANINYPIIAAAMEGATGERFDRLMARLVFQPLRLDACFNWVGCSDGAVARAITLYRPDGSVAKDDLAGQRPACPVVPAADGGCDLARYRLARNGAAFSPQGGLRISMRGLARIGEMLLRDGDHFLTRQSVARLMQTQPVMLPVQPADSPTPGEGGEGVFFCRYGLGVQQLATLRAGCRDDPFGDGRPRIGHAGDAYSLRLGLWLDRQNGTGVAYFLTQSPEFGAPPGRYSAFTAAEEALLADGGFAPAPAPAARAR
ncbi:MAG: serine hydrolase domain-containing protein [Sphingopyxis sp.]